MSLFIEIETVRSVLIAGRWYDIEPGSFMLDSYEFGSGDDSVHDGGNSGICATGFQFEYQKAIISGQLNSIAAVSDRSMEVRGAS